MPLTNPSLKDDPRIQEAYRNRNRPIALGEQGISVARIQFALDRLHYPLPKSIPNGPTNRGADGIFGQETLGAVKKFQGDQGIKADGMVGQHTLDKLDAALGSGPAPTPPVVPTGPTHDKAISDALIRSRISVNFALLRFVALQSELRRIDGLTGPAAVSAISIMAQSFAREIALLARRLFIPLDPMSQHSCPKQSEPG